jgi:hypothetical protein
MSEKIKTSEAGYIYDPASGAIINDNQNEWLKYQAERSRAIEFINMKKQIQDLTMRIIALEEKQKDG